MKSLTVKPSLSKISGCEKFGDATNCTANEVFEMEVELKCVGGECGDAKVWLDPVDS